MAAPDYESARDDAAAAPETISQLLSYRIAVVSNTLSRVAHLRFRSNFDVSIAEWRLIGLLGEREPRSVGELGRAANLDITQASRVAQELASRGLVERQEPPGRGRPVWIRLTPAGKQLYRQLIADANARHARILEGLTPRERQQLDRLLEKLTALARGMLSEERRRLAAPAGQPATARDEP